jgi:hypothetical protein
LQYTIYNVHVVSSTTLSPQQRNRLSKLLSLSLEIHFLYINHMLSCCKRDDVWCVSFPQGFRLSIDTKHSENWTTPVPTALRYLYGWRSLRCMLYLNMIRWLLCNHKDIQAPKSANTMQESLSLLYWLLYFQAITVSSIDYRYDK